MFVLLIVGVEIYMRSGEQIGVIAKGERKYVNTLQLNLKSGPGTEYEVITKLSQGEPVTRFESVQSHDGGTWVRIRAGTLEGWVNEKLLSNDQPPRPSAPVTQQPPPQPTIAEGERKYVNTLQLNLRSGPGAEYEAITKLSQGEPVARFESVQSHDGGTWVRIRAGTLEGWVNEKLLSNDQSQVSSSNQDTYVASNSLSVPLQPGQEVKINYHSEATSYVEHMINYAQNEAKVILVKSKFEKLRKPPRGNRTKARKLNDEALALIRQSKDAEAISFLEDAHKTDPMDAEIANNLASAYFNISFNNNDFSKAKAMLVDTLHLKPDRSIAWANLGRIFAMEGNEYAATNCYINFYRFSNNQKEALQHLAAGRSDPHPVLSKAFANAYQYVSTVSTNSRR